MSQYEQNPEVESKDNKKLCDKIVQRIEPKEKDLGEFTVRRVLPQVARRSVGPFVFFDHMGPAEFPIGKGVNVRQHPHIGLSTVTYLFEGEFHHKDGLGTDQIIQPGAINLMTAGKGIVHSERSPKYLKEKGHRTHGLQLWMALPVEHEDTEPGFQHYPSDQIPQKDSNGTKIRVMMGEAFGLKSPVNTLSKTIYYEVNIKTGNKIILAENCESAIYIVKGQLSHNGEKLDSKHMFIVNPDCELEVKAEADTVFVVIGGDNLGERHIFWNFVSSSKEKIQAAKELWKNGGFERVKDEEDFIPLPE